MPAQAINSSPVLEETEGLVRRLFEFVELVRQELHVRLAEAADSGVAPTTKTIRGLAAVLQGRLAIEGSLVAGAGVALAPGVLPDVERHMEWWTRPADGSPTHPLVVSFDPQSLSYYDYITAEWYRNAETSGGRTVVGPYVDAFGTDENIITLSVPCYHDDRFVGVCSLDIRLGELGERVSRALREMGQEAALINSEGRVIASTSLSHLPGSLLGSETPNCVRGELTGWGVAVFERG